jgi:HSP20 family molecular chaperone IbpA
MAYREGFEMTESESRELQAKEKKEITSPAEQTRPGLVFTPVVDIFETEQQLTLLADIPGVNAEDVTIDLRDNVLTIMGEVAQRDSSGESALLAEYETGKYYRQFTLSEVIDQSKIDAKIADGVLRLTLPKVEKATPKRIAVTAG